MHVHTVCGPYMHFTHLYAVVEPTYIHILILYLCRMNRYSSTKNVECVISEEDIVDPYADDQHEQRWS